MAAVGSDIGLTKNYVSSDKAGGTRNEYSSPSWKTNLRSQQKVVSQKRWSPI